MILSYIIIVITYVTSYGMATLDTVTRYNGLAIA
jgi:hypothetical protein